MVEILEDFKELLSEELKSDINVIHEKYNAVISSLRPPLEDYNNIPPVPTFVRIAERGSRWQRATFKKLFSLRRKPYILLTRFKPTRNVKEQVVLCEQNCRIMFVTPDELETNDKNELMSVELDPSIVTLFFSEDTTARKMAKMIINTKINSTYFPKEYSIHTSKDQDLGVVESPFSEYVEDDSLPF